MSKLPQCDDSTFYFPLHHSLLFRNGFKKLIWVLKLTFEENPNIVERGETKANNLSSLPSKEIDSKTDIVRVEQY